jgi:hypothetical protein
MRECIISGKLTKVDAKTSKAGKPYSMIYVEDKDGTVEMVAGSKVVIPPEGSYVFCSGSIRSTPKQYQDKVFYSYSFLVNEIEKVTEFELTEPEENSLPDVDFSDAKIPF